MRFTIILFLGLVLMMMSSTGNPKTYLVETDNDLDETPVIFDAPVFEGLEVSYEKNISTLT